MKRLLNVLAFSSIGLFACAQDAGVKDIQASKEKTEKATDGKCNKNGWCKGGNVSVNFTQVGNSNWISAGNDKFSLTTLASVHAYACKKWGRSTWDNLLDVNYGMTNTTSQGIRKVNDRIDFVSNYGYTPKIWKNASLNVFGQFRSQLTDGFDYDYLGTAVQKRTSGFFAPAYITLAPGIECSPKKWLSIFISPIAGKWTIVSNAPYSYYGNTELYNGKSQTPLATLYGVDPTQEYKGQFGAFLTATLHKNIMKNIDYYSKLDLYSNYLKHPENVDMFWTNQFKLKVNRFIQVSYTLDMQYDDDVKNPKSQPGNLRPIGLQMLSTLGVGFATKF